MSLHYSARLYSCKIVLTHHNETFWQKDNHWRPFSSESESDSAVSDSLYPMDYTVHGILQARILEWVAFPSRIFPAQGSNPGLPHCRQILYQLSHKGSPFSSGTLTNRILSCLRRLLRTGKCPTDTTATVQWSSAKYTRVQSRCFSLDFGTQTWHWAVGFISLDNITHVFWTMIFTS